MKGESCFRQPAPLQRHQTKAAVACSFMPLTLSLEEGQHHLAGAVEAHLAVAQQDDWAGEGRRVR